MRQPLTNLELRTHHSVREIEPQVWDGLAGEPALPHLRWAFLDALEQTGCVRPEVGWMPAHLSLWREGQVLAVAPAYIKGNSEGEFVFDHGWAQFAYQRLGVEYYPKLVIASPFTPATGPRVLCREDVPLAHVAQALSQGIPELAARFGLSSAHVLFPSNDQAEALRASGWLPRFGIQYHWFNDGYATFEDFLSRYPSKRRNQIRRERRELQRQGIELEVLSGSDLRGEAVGHAYRFYKSTVHKFLWGRQYLNFEFFEEVCSRLRDQVVLVLAREKGTSRYVGGAFNLVGGERLYGRYWGAEAEHRFLHFNVCYYAGIDYCIAHRLQVFEPGAGGEHKVARGFQPTLTHSVHYLRDPTLEHVVADFLQRERQLVEQELAEPFHCFKQQSPG